MSHDQLPPYEDVKTATSPLRTEDTTQQQSSRHSTRPGEPDATIVLICNFDRSQPNGKQIIATAHEAAGRVARRAEFLKLKGDTEDMNYSLMFDTGKKPPEFTGVPYEETWQACRILLGRTEGSRLMFYALSKEDAKYGATGDVVEASGKGGGARRTSKKCIVQ